MPIESHEDINKWKQLLAIVNHHSILLQPNLTPSFKKLMMSRLLAGNVLVFLLQYIGLTLSPLSSYSSLIWPATGTACAFTFLRGFNILPGIWLGSFLAYYCEKANFVLAADFAMICVLQSGLLLWVSYRYIGPMLTFYQIKPFLKFIFCCCVIAGIASFLLMLMQNSKLEISQPWQCWLVWLLANLNGILIFSFAIVAWDIHFPEIHVLKKINKFKLIFLYGLLGVLMLLFISAHSLPAIAYLALLTFLLTLIISAKFGWCGSVAAVFLCGFILTLAIFLQAPLFTNYLLGNKTIFLQLFLAFGIIMALLFSLLQPGTCNNSSLSN